MGNSDPQNTNLYDPLFNEAWEKSILYNLADWVNGIAFRDVNFTMGGKPVIKIAEVKNGLSNQTKYTDSLFDPTVHVTSGDMLFCWSGQPETSIDIFYWRGVDGWLNQHIFKVNVLSKINPRYFFYIMKYIKPNLIEIAKNKQTTGLGHVTKKDLQNISVRYPSSLNQQAIAHILGTLDDKIELLRSMNETLEAIARSLFKSWFIDFDPVRKKAEGQPTGLPPEIDALFPDSFVDSELGEIPKGWEVSTIRNEAELLYGKALKEDSRIPGKVAVYGSNGIVGSHTESLESGPGIIVGRKGNPGFVKWAYTDYFVIDTAFYVKPLAGLSKFYLYWALLYLDLPRLSSDSAVPGISRDSILQCSILAPPKNLIAHFDSDQGSIRKMMHSNEIEVMLLTKIRDSLLPKLISGEIELSDKDISKIKERVK